MKTMRKIFHHALAAAAVLLFAAAAAPSLRAQDLAAIKAGMGSRLDRINELKKSGALGENNKGYLEVRENQGNAAEVAAAENADRKTVYQVIATQQKTSVEAVEKARAQQIHQSSPQGFWVQNPQGEWARK